VKAIGLAADVDDKSDLYSHALRRLLNLARLPIISQFIFVLHFLPAFSLNVLGAYVLTRTNLASADNSAALLSLSTRSAENDVHHGILAVADIDSLKSNTTEAKC
jgi:hypothetical protein